MHGRAQTAPVDLSTGERLERAERLQQVLLDCSVHDLLGLDCEGLVTFANAAA